MPSDYNNLEEIHYGEILVTIPAECPFHAGVRCRLLYIDCGVKLFPDRCPLLKGAGVFVKMGVRDEGQNESG